MKSSRISRMKRFAVIGNPITHSLSPTLHRQFAKHLDMALQYETILLDNKRFEQQIFDFFATGGDGLNVTAPGKKRAFDLATVKTARCLKAGVANTLWMDSHQNVCADNTDGFGFEQAIKRYGSLQGARILLLGAGGAAQAILPVLLNQRVEEITLYNRTKAHALACSLASNDRRVICQPPHDRVYDMIINSTGYNFLAVPKLGGTPFCYDLSYAMSGVTPFVAWARQLGYAAVDGFSMLVAQARESFFVWHGVRSNI